MILQEIRLHNFGLYRGEQVLNLVPHNSAGKMAPIILFGGMNGGGKTTILDAVQIALYGARAQCSKRSGRPYDVFLTESIHHGVPLREGAAVALRFLYASDEGQQEYEVSRTWMVRDDKLRETLHVSKNGERDRWLSENWNQLVEDLIPLSLSQLFFFDAEKIRFLAEDDTCSDTLGNAIKSLLGLDLAERLIADSSVLESRLARLTSASSPNAQLEQLELSFNTATDDIRRLKENRAASENRLQISQRDVQRVEDEFSNLGGKHWEQRDKKKLLLKNLEDQRSQIFAQLQHAAAGELPFALVLPALQYIQEQVRLESESKYADVIRKVVADRDSRMIDALKAKSVSERTLSLIRSWQKSDVQDTSTRSAPLVYTLSDGAVTLLCHLQAILPESMQSVATILSDLEDIRRKVEDTERSIVTASNDAELQPVLDRLKSATVEHAIAVNEALKIDREIEERQIQLALIEQQLQKHRRASIDADIQNEESGRLAKLVDRTRATMRTFLERSTRNKIERLSRYVTESFRYLLRKTTLVERIHIDPDSFRIILYDQTGQAIPKERLSEGEKQIFAIALLWGLGRASTRPLPTIIDTPMGRLDSTHRDYLIERYFPNASHQVVILSTDTEVDKEFYERLSPSITRAYHLSYNEDERYTKAEEGYFWELSDVPTSRGGQKK